ncbi:MAG: hypothetical protein KF708_01105 [Pirellulales bacterium]|nr:hypothetical protein [Pirellulales bacterium]
MHLTRRSLLGRAALAVAGTMTTTAAASSSQGADLRKRETAATVDEQQRLLERYREGMQLDDEQGEFLRLAGRWVFRCQSSGARFSVLENLCLERVAEQVADSPDATNWTASGLITEFRGARYLLLSRAVQKAEDASENI